MPYSMTQILITRTFNWTQTNGTVTQVQINFGTPDVCLPGDPGDYYCPIQLVGFDDNTVYTAFGVDAFDSIAAALELAPALIETSSIGNQLDWDAASGYGFPSRNVPPDGNIVSGTIQLENCNDPVQNITFEFRPASGDPPTVIHQVLTPLTADTGSFTIYDVPDGTYDIAIKGFCWLRKVIPGVVIAGSNVSGLSVFLFGGDINNDNIVDISDFGEFANNYGVAGDP